MLLPLFGFVVGVISSGSLGALVLALHPQWKLTFRQLVCFVGGSFAAVIGSSVLYGWLFAPDTHHAPSRAFIIGFLATLCLATLGGGLVGTALGRRFFSPATEVLKAD